MASFLGHKNASETLNTYAQLWPNDAERITAAIDAGFRRDVHERARTLRPIAEPTA